MSTAMLTEDSTASISSGHKLLGLAQGDRIRLYGRTEYDRRAVSVSRRTWNRGVLPAIREGVSDAVSSRVTAAARRAKAHASLYETRRPKRPEFATEALFDDRLFKVHPGHLSRAAIRDQIRQLELNGQPICMALPLFSRKPVCPLKNRGHLPDLAEIGSLARCYEVASVLSQFHPHGVIFRLFADGHKYRRACRTPQAVVDEYQAGLEAWIDGLGIDPLVTLTDYESAVCAALGAEGSWRREQRYEETCEALRGQLDPLFDPSDLGGSLRRLDADSVIGQQAQFTFQSIVISTYYQTDGVAERLVAHDDAAQAFYLEYVRALEESPSSFQRRPARDRELMAEMRLEAWGAALRYLAISSTDRDLSVWTLLNADGLKFTIHGKPGEFHFRSTSSDLLSMTAQHCVGGIKQDAHGSKVTFAYRLERESRGDCPLLLSVEEGPPGEGPVRRMVTTRQCIGYIDSSVSDPLAALEDYIAHG